MIYKLTFFVLDFCKCFLKLRQMAEKHFTFSILLPSTSCLKYVCNILIKEIISLVKNYFTAEF